MSNPAWQLTIGNGPIAAAAIHNGHALRPEVAELHILGDADRLREEDPFTGTWTIVGDTQIVGLRSRFEVDLNRPPDKAVYINPDDCWGLGCWHCPPAEELVQRSLAVHTQFYAEVRAALDELAKQHGRVVLFDLHSYNHRREGPDGPPADPAENPEVNIGTGTMDRTYWSPVVDAIIQSLRDFDFAGRRLDVRENVRFQGGYFPRWIHETFPRQVCAPAIEFKKFFMDEWTGRPDPKQLELIRQALASAVSAARLALNTMR